MFAAAIWFADLIVYDLQYASFDHATATPSFAISNNFNNKKLILCILYLDHN